MWSDELRIWRRHNDNMNTTCIATIFKVDGCHITVWRIFSWYCIGPVIHMEAPLNIQKYLNAIAYHIHPVMLMIYPAADGYFLQSNAPSLTAGVVCKWFEEHN
ncbi:hypothetical protein TNCV_1176671 [Trichonephila clavipes]|nr:hypothetical protein TNCV_1176671 [Trichonephila clavipes]